MNKRQRKKAFKAEMLTFGVRWIGNAPKDYGKYVPTNYGTFADAVETPPPSLEEMERIVNNAKAAIKEEMENPAEKAIRSYIRDGHRVLETVPMTSEIRAEVEETNRILERRGYLVTIIAPKYVPPITPA